NYILHNALNNYCTAYLNNVLIFSKTRAKYTKYINKGLYAKLLKYIFYTKNVKFLGFIITPRGIIIDPNRV
ncbi:uncharacterized protein K441DRAFT_449467, partial [Cenococcum geophilum 1.58]|uniref:uncharacterized protein n=1 Tax=Cenococcum geophilum 1.58 TaxID=794803 RepID=UPI00358F3693